MSSKYIDSFKNGKPFAVELYISGSIIKKMEYLESIGYKFFYCMKKYSYIVSKNDKLVECFETQMKMSQWISKRYQYEKRKEGKKKCQ